MADIPTTRIVYRDETSVDLRSARPLDLMDAEAVHGNDAGPVTRGMAIAWIVGMRDDQIKRVSPRTRRAFRRWAETVQAFESITPAEEDAEEAVDPT